MSRIEIQELIDNEVPYERREVIMKHLQECSDCRSLHQASLRDRMMIHTLLSELDKPVEQKSETHDFRVKHIRSSLLGFVAEITAAAAILALILLLRHHDPIFSASQEEMILYEFNGEDLNKLWHEKAVVIDENANFVNPIYNF